MYSEKTQSLPILSLPPFSSGGQSKFHQLDTDDDDDDVDVNHT